MSKRLLEFVPQAYIDEKLAELRAIEAPAMISRSEALSLLKDEIIRLASKGHSTADILKRLNSGAQVIRKADIEAMLSKSSKKPRAARKRAAEKSASAPSSPDYGTNSARKRHDDGTQQEQSITAFTGVIIPTEKASDV